MMKREKRFCRVARSHPLSDLQAIEDDLLRSEVHEDQRSLLRRMHKVHRTKAYVHFLWIILALMASLVLVVDHDLKAQTTGNPFAAPYLNIDPVMIPSGLLHNQSPWYFDAFEYDTLSNTLQLNHNWIYSPYLLASGNQEIQSHVFMHLYQEMLFAQINDSVIINPEDYKIAWDQASALYDMPISLMLLDFHQLPEDALTAGKVFFDTITGTFGPYPDTLWFPDTMYLPDTVFFADSTYYLTFQNPDSLLASAFQKHSLVASMMKEEVFYLEDNILTLNFCVPEYLAVNNLDTLPQIYIDFDDGAGLQLVPWGVVKQITYNLPPQPRVQEIQLKIRVPAFLPDVYVINKFFVSVYSVLPDTVINTNDLPPGCELLEGSTPAEGSLSIRFADNSVPELKKPVLFVEGFETALDKYGKITFLNIMNELMPSLGFPEIQEMPLLFDSLKELGFDLVYLDFANSRDSLERIMLTVAKAIQWVNSELVANGSQEKLVVASASMGGVTTRYALKMMELNQCCHNTRLWISFDAPQRGANIPVGIQYMVEHAAETSRNWKGLSWPLSWIDKLMELGMDLNVPSVEGLYDLVLNSPAARTMLIQHIDPAATTHHVQFYAMLDDLGYPEYCRKISLINGSEQGVKHQLDDPQGRILGTGKVASLPKAWITLLPGTNLASCLAYFPWHFEDFRIAYSLVLNEEEPMIFERNDWGESVEALNNILLSSALHTGLNGVFGFAGLAAAASLNLPLAAFMEGCMIGNKLIGNSKMSDYHNAAPLITMPSTGLLPLTTAPGGLNDALEKLGDSFDGKVETYSEKFSFIPSVSALDVKDVALDVDLEESYLTNMLTYSPFDAYWAPRRGDSLNFADNQMHVEVMYDNRYWIIDHVLHDWALRGVGGVYQGVLSGIYNYSRPSVNTDIVYVNQPYQKVLYSTDVLSGGELLVNAQMDIGLPGSYLLPKPMGHFRLVTSGDVCDPAEVRVMTGGTMVLGDPLNYNTAEVFLSPNSSLELHTGSVLKLYGASSLVVSEGASLIVHPGAVIELHHADAVLEVRGKLVLPDGSALSVTGPGYVRYNTAMTSFNYNDYFSLGQNASIDMSGTGGDDRKLMFVTDTWLPTELTLKVTNAAITLEEDVFLATSGPVWLNQTHVRADDTNALYGGVVLYGQQDVTIKNSTFSHAQTALKANLAIGGNPLLIEGCLFRNNHTGLYTSDEKVRLVDCTFRDNQYGWYGENMAGISVVDQSLFKENLMAGVRFAGQISSVLLFRESTLEQNFHGVQMYDGVLQANCSHFTHNTYSGIMAEKNARVLLGNASKNHLTNNYIGIALNEALELDILNGHLKFSGNNYYVIGELLSKLYFDLDNNTLKPLDFSGNHMPVLPGGLPVHPYIYHPVTYQLTPFNVVLQNVVPQGWTNCVDLNASVSNEHLTYPVTLIAGASVIQGGVFNNYLLTDALLQAANLVSCDEYAGNDTLAISAFHQILTHLPAQLSEAERGGIDYALELMTLALGNAIENELIDPNRGLDGTPVDAYVEMIAAQVQEQLDNLDHQAAFSEEAEARYALLKAQMYRVAEHYDYALEILDEISVFSGTSLSNEAVYWGCVCASERLLLIDSIDRAEFHLKMDSCSLALITARMLPYMPQFGVIPVADLVDPDQWVKQVFPNPANQRVVVELAVSAAGVQVEMMDVNGKVVHAMHLPYSTNRLNIDLPELSPGIYVLKIGAGNIVSHHKIMVKQTQ